MPRLALLLAAVLFGTTGTAQALLAAGAPPLAVGAGRIVVGGAALALVAIALGALRGPWPLRLVLLAAVGVAVYQLAFFAALVQTGVAVGTVVAIGSGPIVAGLLQWRLEGRSPGLRWGLATALAAVGVAVLTFASGSDASLEAVGIVLALVAGGGYAGYTIVARRLIDAGHRPLGVMGAAFGTSGILLLPVLAATGASLVADARPLALVLYLGLVPTALAYVLFARGLARVSAAEATTIVLVEPVTAAILGALVLGERLTAGGLAGAALVLGGIAVLALPVARLRRGPATPVLPVGGP